MEKYSFLKQALIENAQIFVHDIPGQGVRVFKHAGKKIFLLCQETDERKRLWLVSGSGVRVFNSAKDAFDEFFGLIKVSTIMSFIRKSSYQKLKNVPRSRIAKIVKNASINYDNDAWIENPEQLISDSNRQLWSLTKSGNFAARLFDEKQFPLDS